MADLGGPIVAEAATLALALRAVAAVVLFLVFLAGFWFLTWTLVLSKVNFFREIFGFHKLVPRTSRRSKRRSA